MEAQEQAMGQRLGELFAGTPTMMLFDLYFLTPGRMTFVYRGTQGSAEEVVGARLRGDPARLDGRECGSEGLPSPETH